MHICLVIYVVYFDVGLSDAKLGLVTWIHSFYKNLMAWTLIFLDRPSWIDKWDKYRVETYSAIKYQKMEKPSSKLPDQ